MTINDEGAANPARQRWPIVCLHGTGDNAHHWDRLIACLPEHPNIALDLPGHGANIDRPGPAEMGIVDYADHVRAELTRRGLKDVCLVGHSLGSAIALRLAVDHPSLVRRLVLVGAGARLRVLPALLEVARTNPAATMRELVDMGFAPRHQDEAKRYYESLLPVAPGVVRRDLIACDRFDMMEELGHISQTALLVTGEEDRLTPPKYARYLQEHLAAAQLRLLPGAGHYAAVEAPDAVADTIGRWLA
jgi:pimeloyl-ACP methyl ester carboxylesterase